MSTEAKVTKRTVLLFEDILFGVAVESDEFGADFRIYEIQDFYAADGAPAFTKEEEDTGAMIGVAEMQDADVFAHGHVKWDGCSNWMFNECADSCYIHACDRKGLLRLGEVLARCHDWTRDNLSEEFRQYFTD